MTCTTKMHETSNRCINPTPPTSHLIQKLATQKLVPKAEWVLKASLNKCGGALSACLSLGHFLHPTPPHPGKYL